MEALIAVLFIVFSVGSALLERRKRRLQVEEGRKAFKDRETQRQEEVYVEEVEQEVEREVEEEWPFPIGGFDPFEPESPEPDRSDLEEIEQQEQAAEERATAAAARANQLEAQAQDQRQKAHTELLSQRRVKRKGRLIFEARAVRDAIVYAEILGPPKAEQEDND